jgi:hypothetical protein
MPNLRKPVRFSDEELNILLEEMVRVPLDQVRKFGETSETIDKITGSVILAGVTIMDPQVVIRGSLSAMLFLGYWIHEQRTEKPKTV